jgi:uracil-DNA glycosylase
VFEGLPEEWARFLGVRLAGLETAEIRRALADTEDGRAFPPRECVFEAFRLTSPGDVRAVILGQDPYPTKGQACGLAFSVPNELPSGVRRPQSLGRILTELRREGFSAPERATLGSWPAAGVLMLNTALTVAANDAGSHSKIWTEFTRAVLGALVERPEPIAFLLWGRHAQEWCSLIRSPHQAVCSPHPAARGRSVLFAGSCPFTRANAVLGAERKISWSLT